MTTRAKTAANTSGAIREEISTFTQEQLLRAKPADLLPILEERGIEITPSVRSMTSRLLSAAKRECRAVRLDLPVTDPTVNDRMEAALTFVKACGGLKAAKRALDIFEEVARMAPADN